MILVCLGTQDLPFTRLLALVEDCIVRQVITEEVIVQQGYTKFQSNHMKLFPFCSNEEMESYMDQAALIITHAGTGTIVTALKKGKKVIAVNRLRKFGEHTDDHQKEIVEQFSSTGYLLSCGEEECLADKIIESKEFVVPLFESNTAVMLEFLRTYIRGMIGEERK